MNNQISIIIATKKFSKNLFKTINSINKQSFSPNEIIIVSNKKIIKNFNLNKRIILKKFISKIKNQVFQRNIAIKNLSKKSHLILQLDDRIILEKNCLYELNKFWNKTNSSTIGVGLNQIKEVNDNGFANRLINRFFNLKGKVLSNGMIIDYSSIHKDLEVMWLKGGLSSWKIKKNKNIYNRKYPLHKWSVFEDVEFSLSKSANHKLFVSHKAKAKIIERKKDLDFKNLFYRGNVYIVTQKKIVKKYFGNITFFFLSMPFLVFLSLIFSILTINISKLIYNLGRIRGFFTFHFN